MFLKIPTKPFGRGDHVVVSAVGYDPAIEPWRFSGNARSSLKGKCPASMLLTDPRMFYCILEWAQERGMKPEQNKMLSYLLWAKNKLEMIKPIAACPHCINEMINVSTPFQPRLFELDGEEIQKETKISKSIHYLSVIEDNSGISVGLQYACCDNETCKSKLISSVSPGKRHELLPATFHDVAKSHYHEGDYRKIINVLQRAYGINGKVTAQKAHDFLLLGTF